MDSILVNTLISDPDRFPHPVTELCLIETHIAWLIKTGEYVYKIKKPVNFGFLDFTTLEQRKFYCEEEVRLNRRLSSDLYLGVVEISGSDPDPQLESGQPPIEYAVKLRQFESGRLLSDLIQKPEFEPHWLDQLSKQIAEFHQRAPIVSPDSPWGEPKAIMETVENNYRYIDRKLLSAEDAETLDRLWTLAHQRFEALEALMKTRKLSGYVRECHGDLHLGNITLHNNSLLVFDCIEFNKEFRWIDQIQDLAFLLMDLEALGQYAWANRCLNRYLEISGDYEGVRLLSFYKAHRAMVRAKVAMLGEQPDYPTFKHYLKLSERYARSPEPRLIMMHGVSGSGKSYLAGRLAERINAVWVRSDVERKRLYRAHSLQGERLDLYGPDMNTRTFLKLSETTQTLLSAGQTVILDATHLKRRTRQHFMQLADTLEIPVRLLSCNAPESVRVERLSQRQTLGTDPSDADAEVMRAQHAALEPLDASELQRTLKVDTQDPSTLERIIADLRQQAMLSDIC